MFRLHSLSRKKVSLALFAVGVVVSFAAAALPYPNPGEGYIQTYYSDAARTQVVGERSYGNCGENFSWGVLKGYFTLTKITCGSGGPD
ncbi:hypothetical protein [Lysobacter capsici]|jgi:hypothetical protein|uniref:hypothetical protein n=1 Tax=Lysobacter capsici TaxID=435897 RepID=UPI000BBA8DA2|nr:hypothetical protein [Lysobacter capsici]ATE73794.1 hypothetical protein CNO08_21955 [Lysobacter capsici]